MTQYNSIIKLRHMWMSISGIRQSIIFQPLAVLMAILVSPLLPIGGKPEEPKPFAAQAQTITPYCTADGVSLNGVAVPRNCLFNIPALDRNAIDLGLLEREAAEAYVTSRGIPVSEASKIYQYGRKDLRNAVRAIIYSKIANIIMTPANQRSARDQRIYTWLQEKVQANEVLMRQTAYSHFNQFKIDPCHFRTDSDLAKTFSFDWDPVPFCRPVGFSAIFAPMSPTSEYFKAYGMKNSFQKGLTEFPDYADMFVDTSISLGAQYGIGFAIGAAITAAAAAAIGSSIAAAAAAYAAEIAAGASVAVATSATYAGTTGFVVGGLTASSITAGAAGIAAIAGTVTIVLICAIAAGISFFQVVNDETQRQDMERFRAEIPSIQANLPDLTLYKDSLSVMKIMHTILGFTMEEVASTVPLPSPLANDRKFLVETNGNSSLVPAFRFVDWENNQWLLYSTGSWLAGNCTQSPGSKACYVADSFSGSFRYVDTAGVRWTATILPDNNIMSVKLNQVSGVDKLCTVDPSTGLTSAADVSKCVTHISKKITLRAPNNVIQTLSVTTNSAPNFLDSTLFFSRGVGATKNITVSASPTGTICVSGLPANFTSPSTCVSGNSYPITYNGSLTSPVGTTILTVNATNDAGANSTRIVLDLRNDLNIVSSNVLTGTAATPFRFTVRAVGNPTPRLTLDSRGYDLSGLTFTDNGDGTATLAGTYTGSALDQQCLANCGFIATNSSGVVTQPFRLLMNPADSASKVGPSDLTVYPGQDVTLNFSSSGARTPVRWEYVADSGAPWITFRDNGDGTATLRAAPPAGTSGSFRPAFVPIALGSGLVPLTSFPVTVPDSPGFISNLFQKMYVGLTVPASVQASSGSISTTATLPSGVVFSPGNPAVFSGRPAAGTGGDYFIPVTASSSAGSMTQNVQLRVLESPAFTTPNVAVVYAGTPASVTASASGFPSNSTKVMAANAGPPTSPDLGEGMFFNVLGIPPGLSASNLNELGFRSNLLRIQGSPTTPGTYRLSLLAINAVGLPGKQTMQLVVLPALSPTAPNVNLLGFWALDRDADNNIVANVVITNNGKSTADNVSISSIRLGTYSGQFAPSGAASLASGATATFRVVFPGTGGLGSGSASSISISATHSGGSFSTSGRVQIP